MRVQEIIRGILDLIDKAEQPATTCSVDASPEDQPYNDDVRRFKQIVDLADSGEATEYSNTPKEEYAGIDAVTSDAGGGMQSPKHPDDIRGNSFKIYRGSN